MLAVIVNGYDVPIYDNGTGWPDNKEKCTNLFNYCITYVNKHNNTDNPNGNNNNGLKDDDPFVVKVSLGMGGKNQIRFATLLPDTHLL